jgi:hypothetical protein
MVKRSYGPGSAGVLTATELRSNDSVDKWLGRGVSIILIVSWIVILGSVIAGIAMMAWRDPQARHWDSLSISHPLFFPGFAVLIGGTIQGIFLAMIASFIWKQRSISKIILKKLNELFVEVKDVKISIGGIAASNTTESSGPETHKETTESPPIRFSGRVREGIPDKKSGPGWYRDQHGTVRWWNGQNWRG